jgi:TPR repeat protein
MVSKRYIAANSSNVNMLSAILSPAAEAGHTEAQHNLGWMYQNGKGVKMDLAKAVEWYQKGMFVNSSKYQHTQRGSFTSRRS